MIVSMNDANLLRSFYKGAYKNMFVEILYEK